MRKAAAGGGRTAMRALVFGLLLVVAGGARAQQPALEVITLNYRSADEVIPVLKPMLAPGGTISGLQNRVIIRTTPQNLAELRKVLETIDALPRRLLISVRQDSSTRSASNESELSGSIGSDRARVTVPGTGSEQGGNAEIRRGDDRAKLRVLKSQSASASSTVQTMQVLEGNEAHIHVGQSVPIASRSLPSGSQNPESVQYRDAGTGFRVRPRISGDRVTLEISSQRDSVTDATGQGINVQNVSTVVTGRLGQWIELAGIGQGSIRRDIGTLSRNDDGGTEDRKVYLKVDAIP